MIGYLEGLIQSVLKDSVIINTSGVGYRVFVGEDALRYKKGDKLNIYIYTHVRENELKLFGFKDEKMLLLFEMLIGVNGIGPKAALSLINELGVKNVINSILQKESKELKVKGVGIKTANKIVIELHDKLEKEGFCIDKGTLDNKVKSEKVKEKLDEVSDALMSLGYKSKDVKRLVDLVSLKEKVFEMEVEQIIKYILSKGNR